MSGPLAQYRTPSKPQFYEGIPVFNTPRRVLRPGGVYKNGRCTEWITEYVPRPFQVLDYRPQPHIPGKHSRGRTFARNARQRRHFANQRARLVQAVKTATVDHNTMRAFRDEI